MIRISNYKCQIQNWFKYKMLKRDSVHFRYWSIIIKEIQIYYVFFVEKYKLWNKPEHDSNENSNFNFIITIIIIKICEFYSVSMFVYFHCRLKWEDIWGQEEKARKTLRKNCWHTSLLMMDDKRLQHISPILLIFYHQWWIWNLGKTDEIIIIWRNRGK